MASHVVTPSITTGLLGWFQTQVALQDLTDTEIGYFEMDHRGAIGGSIPSLYKSLSDCDRAGGRTAGLDGSIQAVRKLGWSKIKNIKSLLMRLIYKIDETYPVPIPVIPAEVLELLPCDDSTRDTLAAMVRCAATNVTSFETVPPRGRLTEIKNRSWAALQDDEKADSIAAGNAPVSSRSKKHQFDLMADGVFSAQAGVCTTFAAAAASLLLEDREKFGGEYRVEYIAAPKHCFCLLNRVAAEGSEDQVEDRYDVISSYSLWNPEVVIIDPWAGAMGFHVISTPDTYPSVLKSMIGLGLKKFYDTDWPV